MTERQILRTIDTKLRESFEVRRMILFGSRARGEAKPGSDFDVLCVAETEVPFIERQGLALLALGPRSFSVDLLVYTPTELEREASIPGSAVYWALKEGVEFGAN